jgi:hypothetical protein
MRLPIAVPLVQLVLYAALIAAGDVQSRHGATPFFDVAYGLNFPAVLPGYMAASTLVQGADPESAIWLQVWIGCLVPLLWLVVVRWYMQARKRVALARPKTLAGRRPATFNPLKRDAAVLFALGVIAAAVWAIIRPEHWVVKVFVVGWVAVMIFMWMARRSRWVDAEGR